MKIAHLTSLILITLTIWSLSCTRTVTIKNHDNFWWIEGNTRVKEWGNERWIKVVKVEADSAYGYYLSPKSDTLVVISLDSLERIKKLQSNDFVPLLQGILLGGVLGTAFVFLITI